MISINILPKPEEVILFKLYFKRRWYVATQKKKNLILMSQTKHSIRVRFIYLISWREFVGWWLVYLIKNSQPLILRDGANYFWPKSFVGNVHLLTQDWLFNRHFITVTIESYFGSFIIAFVLKFPMKSMIPLS